MAASITKNSISKFCNLTFNSAKYGRYLHLSCLYSNKYNRRTTLKAEKRLNKLVNLEGQKKKSKGWYGGSNSPGGGWQNRHGPSPGMQRRADMLSVILCDNITSMINSGEVDDRLPNLAIQISKVKMASDLSQVNVYWYTTSGEQDKELDAILPDIAFTLRHKLIQLRVMGQLPPVIFVKDRSLSRLQQVERLLEEADMGPDHVPTPLTQDMTSPPTLQHATVKLSDLQKKLQDTASKMEQMDITSDKDIIHQNKEYSSDHDEDYNNQLRNDLYNVDHSSLMQKLTQTKASGRSQKASLNIDYNESLSDFNSYQNIMQKKVKKSWPVKKGKMKQRLLNEEVYERTDMYEDEEQYDERNNEDYPTKYT